MQFLVRAGEPPTVQTFEEFTDWVTLQTADDCQARKYEITGHDPAWMTLDETSRTLTL